MKCKHAWSHLDFKPGGYAPCYRFKLYNNNLGKIPDLPSDVINNEHWKDVRRQLRKNEWPVGCKDCRIQEENDIKSYRQRSLESTISTPDYENDNVVITDLQLKMSNTCNFNCMHCDVKSNSNFILVGNKNKYIAETLYKDHNFDHVVNKRGKVIDKPTSDVMDDLFLNIIPNIQKLEFAGGEPFYHIDMYKTLERMINDKNIDTKKITLSYNTNMSLIKFKKYDLIELWKHFKGVHITVSFDGTGNLFNYFRHKGDYNQVVKNLKTIVKNCKNLKSLLLVCTSCSYHVFYMNKISKDFFKLRKELNKISYNNLDINIRTTFVHSPAGLDMVNLDEKTKVILLNEIEENEFTKDIIKRLKGKRTIPKETFKDIVKMQDTLYNRDASLLAPRIFDYVY